MLVYKHGEHINSSTTWKYVYMLFGGTYICDLSEQQRDGTVMFNFVKTELTYDGNSNARI